MGKCSMFFALAKSLNWTVLYAYGGPIVLVYISFVDRVCFTRCEAAQSCRDVVKLLVRYAR